VSVTQGSGVGFFGKLPTLGDFVSRRLPREFIEPWDTWLQASLRASQERLADEWLNVFLVSPIWRFAISPGICGENAWLGVMMPSVDRVGRYYPLTLAAAIPNDRLLDAFLPESTAFTQLEMSALSVLGDTFDFDVFDQYLNSLSLLEQIVPPRFKSDAIPAGVKSAIRFELQSLEQCDAVLPDVCQHLLQRYLPAHSLWATLGSHGSRPSLLCCEGLPPIEAYSNFLKGSAQSSHAWSVQTFLPLTSVLSSSVCAPDIPILNPMTVEGWQSYGLSVVGHKRKHNEDAMLNCPERGLWVVADGMGGHQAGDLASRLIVDSLATLDEHENIETCVETVCAKLQKINQELCRFAEGMQQGSIVGSTVVVLLARGAQCAAIWAGDSRLYRLRNGVLTKITEDHTLLDELLASGLMSREVAERQVGANVITRAVGGQAELLLDVLRFQAEAGDRYLLCSDGLDKEVSEAEVQALLAGGNCQAAAEILINAALKGEGRDNITVVVSHFA